MSKIFSKIVTYFYPFRDHLIFKKKNIALSILNMITLNKTDQLNLTHLDMIDDQLFDVLSSLYICVTVSIILIGLIGNFCIIFIYSIKKNRTNSSHVFLLCSAIVDNLFILSQLIEVNKNNKISFLIRFFLIIFIYIYLCFILNQKDS